jgi:type II secretory ATPase GspE/PulE/Tfp pilus assembly ATPase PilB-like protein
VQDRDGFLFWEDVFDPIPQGADVAEIALRALRLDCNEIYILPAHDWITIQFHRQHKAFKSFRMHRSRLEDIIKNLKLFANLHRVLRNRAEEGSITVKHKDQELSLFVRVVRTSIGERIYLRLL